MDGAQKYNMQPVESRFLSLHPSSEGRLGYAVGLLEVGTTLNSNCSSLACSPHSLSSSCIPATSESVHLPLMLPSRKPHAAQASEMHYNNNLAVQLCKEILTTERDLVIYKYCSRL